ncbi:MAG: L-2-amino-thiazoline-4-carboxylic acid hydrolase [Deltaproteobacteria bacterium]|nr:L-2-amino-thiazoline-4-carboxylic acid hydrolase [Deltaproteobacteria bacterium]
MGPALYLLKPYLLYVLRDALGSRFDERTRRAILAEAYAFRRRFGREVQREATFGARVFLQLSVLVVGVYRALIGRDCSATEARTLVAAVTSRVFSCMVRWADRLSSFTAAASKSKSKSKSKIEAEVEHFKRLNDVLGRRFFAPPAWRMEAIESPQHVVAFDMHRCPLAEYFASQNLSELCVAAICDLDFMLYDPKRVRFERGGTIAGGSERCDFRWRVLSEDEATIPPSDQPPS